MSLPSLRTRLDTLESLIAVEGIPSETVKTSIGSQLLSDSVNLKRILVSEPALNQIIQRYLPLATLIEDPTQLDSSLDDLSNHELLLEAASQEYHAIEQPLMQVESLAQLLDKPLPLG